MQNELKDIKFLNDNEEILEMPILTYFMPKIPHILPNSEEQLNLLSSDRTNNFLTTAFSILAKYPQLIFARLNTETIIPSNKYKVDISLLGEMLTMEVPGEITLCRDSPKCKIDPLFTKHTDTFFFTYLLEKARSLLYNSYLANIIGNPYEVVQEVFGGFYSVYSLKDNMKVLVSALGDKYYRNASDLNKLNAGSYFMHEGQTFEKKAILIKDTICIDNYQSFMENKQKRVLNYSFEIVDVKVLEDEQDKKIILNLKVNSHKEYKYLMDVANIKTNLGAYEADTNGKVKVTRSTSRVPSMNEFKQSGEKENNFPSTIMVDYNKIKNIFKYFSINYFRPPVAKKLKPEQNSDNITDEENAYNADERKLIFNADLYNNSRTFNFMGKIDDHVHYRVFTFELTTYNSVYINVMEKSFIYFMKYAKKHTYNDVRITVFSLQASDSEGDFNNKEPNMFVPHIIATSDKFEEKNPIKSFETHLKPGYYAVAVEIVIKNEFPAYAVNFELNESQFKSFNYIGDLYAYDLIFLYSYINSDKNFYNNLMFVDIGYTHANNELGEERKLMLQAIKENINKKENKQMSKPLSNFSDKDSPLSYGYTRIAKNIHLLYFEKNNQFKKVGIKLNRKVFKRCNIFCSYNLFEAYDITLRDNCTFFLNNKVPIAIFILKAYDDNVDDNVLTAFVKRARGYTETAESKTGKDDSKVIKDSDGIDMNPKYIRYKTKGYVNKSGKNKDASRMVNLELDLESKEPMINNFMPKKSVNTEHITNDLNAYRRGGTRDIDLLKITLQKTKMKTTSGDSHKNSSMLNSAVGFKYIKKVSFNFSKYAKDLADQRSESVYDPSKKPSKGILAPRKSKYGIGKNNELTANNIVDKQNMSQSHASMNTRDERFSNKFFNMLISQSFVSRNLFYHNHNHKKVDIRNQFLKYSYFSVTTNSNLANNQNNIQFAKFNDQRQVKELTDEESIEICKKYGTKFQKSKGSEAVNITEYYAGNENFVLIYIENLDSGLVLREERMFILDNLQLEPNKLFLYMQNNQVFYEVWPNTSILMKLNIVYKHKGYKFDFDVGYDLVNV